MGIDPNWIGPMVDEAGSRLKREIEWKRLTPRQREAIRLMGEGLDLGAIGERMGISIGTVRNYLYDVVRRLGLGGIEDVREMAAGILSEHL